MPEIEPPATAEDRDRPAPPSSPPPSAAPRAATPEVEPPRPWPTRRPGGSPELDPEPARSLAGQRTIPPELRRLLEEQGIAIPEDAWRRAPPGSESGDEDARRWGDDDEAPGRDPGDGAAVVPEPSPGLLPGAPPVEPFEDPNPEGEIWPLTEEGIRGAVEESLPALEECYAGWLHANPDIEGVVLVTFAIAPAAPGAPIARIVGTDIPSSELGHELMEGCVLNVVSFLRFESPAHGQLITVRYPLVFESLLNDVPVAAPPSEDEWDDPNEE